MSTVPPRRAWDGRTVEQELLNLEDWRPLNDEECQAWVAGALGPAPDGQMYGISPSGIAVIYRERSLEAAVVALHSVGAHGLVVAMMDAALERIVHATLDRSPAGHRRWRDGRQREPWRTLATQTATGKAALPPPGIGLPLEPTLRGPLPFDFRPTDVPLRMVGAGRVAARLMNVSTTIGGKSRSI